MMASVAVLLGVSPVVAAGSITNQEVSAATYTTNSKTSSVVTIKSAHFVNKNGKKLSLVAEKGGTYTVYSVKTGKTTYYKVDSSADYWLPASATSGSVTYTKNGATYTLSTNQNSTAAGTVKPHATSTASSSTSSTITLKKNAYIYNSKGKRQGKVYIAKGTVLTSKGTKRIKKKLYYNIGNGHYIKAGNVQTSTVKPHATTVSSSSSSKTTTSNGRPANWQPGDNTLKLKKNAIPYDANGKKRTDLGYTYIKKNTVLNYYGTKKINGKTYYDLGDGVYIKSANVGSITNK